MVQNLPFFFAVKSIRDKSRFIIFLFGYLIKTLKFNPLLNKGNCYLKLPILAFLFPLILHAQVHVVNRAIGWNTPAIVDIIDSTRRTISFEGAVYPTYNALPVWSETFFDDNLSDSVRLDSCVFSIFSESERVLIQSSTTLIPTDLNYSVHYVTSRKQGGISVEILPFKRDLSTGHVLKLISFRIKFSGKHAIEKSLVVKYDDNSVLSEGNWYKLAVNQSGIYRISYSDLVAMGINPSIINPAKIGIFGRGGTMLPEPNATPRADDLPEIAIDITGQADGAFNEGDQILFFAQGPVTWQYNSSHAFWEHTTHLYSDTICYFLTTDRGSGKRISAKSSTGAAVTDNVDSFDFLAFYEENNINLIKSGRQWFSQIFDVILNKSYTFESPVLASGGVVKIRSVTAAKSLNTSSFEFKIGSQSWQAIHSPVSGYSDSPVATGATAYKSLQDISLPLKIDIVYNKSSSSGVGYLDLLDVNARCELRFTSGQLDFRDNKSKGDGHVAGYRIYNAAGKAVVWEVTDPLNAHLITTTTESNDLIFRLSADSIRQFVAFDGNQLLKPRFIQKIPNQNLHASAGADMIIVAPQVFMTQAIRLANFHASSSDLDVLVLDPGTIYNEFSSGTVDITAIRDFMKMLYDKSPSVKMPRYLLLFGDASYDYKDKIPENTNIIPTWQSPESYSPISSLVSDDYFGMLDNNEGQSYSDVIDLGIGRLPVKTALEAEQAVDKIIHYSTPSADINGDWRNVITFVADDEDLNDHITQAEQMAVSIENNYPDINLDKIYLDSYVQVATPQGNRYPDANKAITQRVEKGCLIINYTGHGGETGWAHEEVLTVNEINNWLNFNYLPVFVTATCEFSRYDDPQRRSAGEYVFTNPNGGGIALFTTTRPTYGTPNFELNKKFYQYALSKPGGERLRMGDIIMNSKRDKGSNENGRKYVLLGDPALQISFPSLAILTKSINGHAPSGTADTLKAYMEVNVEGIIADQNGNQVTDFNGTLFPSVFDKSVTLKTLANDGGSTYSFALRKNLLYKGKVVVEDGHFKFTFIVPKDIAYSYDFGKISYYATDGLRDATGLYTNVIVGGSAEPAVSDKTGPDINLYMNSLSFHDGGITDQNPRLLAVVSDENGINTIGNGIGHDITAILDGNTSEPYILNDFYQSDLNTFKSGYIRFPFSLLSTGEHTLSVKVWDIFNNSSVAEIHFNVHSGEEFVISKTYNFPNPFVDYTDIVFEHNQQNSEFSIRAEIYSLTGQLVKIIEQTSSQNGYVSIPIRWDGVGDNGSKMSPGMYVYNLTIRTSGGQYKQTSGKMILR
jgi:hypothetical protein